MNDYQGYALAQTTKPMLKPRRKRKLRFFAAAIIISTFIFIIWFYFSSSGTNWRYMLADTLITTQHRDYAKYLIGQSELDRRTDNYSKQFNDMGLVQDNHDISMNSRKNNSVTVEPITGKKFKGYMMFVHNPQMIRVVTTSLQGQGEQILSMVKRTGAIAGVNGGAFDDPNYDGNGFRPIGVVMSGGKLLYSDGGMEDPVNVVGLDRKGIMVAGRYKPSELLKMGVRDAVSFQPKFIVNGKGLVKNEADGWGIAPRTCMAQTKDGTIIFLVIDGRQPGYSMGATLYDAQQLLLEKGAITAANLDGGSSSVLIKDNQVVNRPSSSYGMRYLPTAFLVFDHPEKVAVSNMWNGVDMVHFNSAYKPFSAKR
ncbi:phosphodiester glycosidase family protein [Paenibacillus sp. PFR10]|uniref:Phosphodiester glycosidase family protein n=2 Tax=Paenibacillus violae TaxID=3077234 RepID=A0ABU3RKV0_9BACL|nr:phosphodiester glycosidase family protein [Paenibacillus sp. PFR10]MDU0204824.1 phosphodiester glycosidase family protein [Paenibacillus sp. PFR10]